MAQAVAAAGRGVAVISDDPRFELRPVRIAGPDGPVRIRLYAAWDRAHHGAVTIASIVEGLRSFCAARYDG